MSETDETASLRRGVRLDLVIAVCALLMSTAATGASWWQSRVVADQLSAQVWPYISISTTYERGGVAVDVLNNGLGPAIIRSTVLTVDGRAYRDPTKAFGRLLPRKRGLHLGAQMSDLGPGDVIRASSSVRVFHLVGAWVVPVAAKNYQRVNLSVCYCSLLGKCWQTTMQQSADPVPIHQCPSVGEAQYKVPVVINS